MPYKNIDPTIWGPPLWKFMHYFTLSYPENPTEDEKDTLVKFFETIGDTIPCEKCRYNFSQHLEKMPITEEILESNVKVVRWLFDLHNEVNKSTNKPVFNYDDFIKLYSTTKVEEVDKIDKIDIVDIVEIVDNNKPVNNSKASLLHNKLFIALVIVVLIVLVVLLNKYL
jgi:hypothetical protein